ncbi:BamA/TamA family outer membrane protein [Hymenobacter sp. IS2118]|uniref:translocation and assembly module lipoprotein TamL n=1 Tax=Hymenobacter sp. IS2118 TaxID=1505605 RepID=UPI000550706B|nr:BamA/TamA family outer membrane protein [Hymenobacter sp. IS2118]
MSSFTRLPKYLLTAAPACRTLLLVPVLLLLASCSGLKFVPEGERLYTGSTVTIKPPADEKTVNNQAALQTELESVVGPKPNNSLLGLRPKLYFWNMGVGKKKGLGKFFADKFGEPPVYLSQAKPATVRDLMVNRLNNNGFFNGKASFEVKKEEKTASIDYTALPGQVYRYTQVNFPQGDTLVRAAIRNTQAESLVKVGDAYNLATLTNERVRIDAALKEQGYYYFAPDYLVFKVDSTLDHKATVDVRLKNSAPPKALRPYWLDEVKLNTSYVLTDTTMRNPMMFRGYQYFPDEEMFKAKAITRATFLYPDSVYRRHRRDQTLSRLMSLGTFRFVEIRFKPAAAGDTTVAVPANAAPGSNRSVGLRQRLDAEVLMTQLKKKSLRAEVQLTTKTNGFTGPALKVTFRNRSAFRGAEQLLINGIASTETQTGGGNGALGLTSFEYGVNAQLLIPRLVTPNLPLLDVNLPNSDFQPRTKIEVGVRAVTRANYFSQNFFNVNYGYTWKTKITNEQEIKPIDITYVQFSPTDIFTDILNTPERSFLKSAFQQQFVLASSYRYTYNQQSLEQRRQQIYFSGQIEGSGNLAQALATSIGTPKGPSGGNTLLGQEYSQYLKLDLEVREYYRISADPASGNRVVARLLAGIGNPYGNSRVLPYPKQYGIGGPNSVRAFAPRGIGPGIYQPKTLDQSSNQFYDQVGDIRLEGNIEYRQDLFPYVKGALFMDAGNIWLVNPDPGRDGAQFKASSFLDQLAVGYGAGIRIDVQFFVIRFDYALPLRAPYGTPTRLNKQGELVPDKAGRLNLAIGYPF